MKRKLFPLLIVALLAVGLSSCSQTQKARTDVGKFAIKYVSEQVNVVDQDIFGYSVELVQADNYYNFYKVDITYTVSGDDKTAYVIVLDKKGELIIHDYTPAYQE